MPFLIKNAACKGKNARKIRSVRSEARSLGAAAPREAGLAGWEGCGTGQVRIVAAHDSPRLSTGLIVREARFGTSSAPNRVACTNALHQTAPCARSADAPPCRGRGQWRIPCYWSRPGRPGAPSGWRGRGQQARSRPTSESVT